MPVHPVSTLPARGLRDQVGRGRVAAATMTALLAALYQQVYDDPDDDDVRRVLADALLAIGDPRGELISAQLAPDADHARVAMRLVQRFGLTWLGALRGVVTPLAYERGFLASCKLDAEVGGVLDAPEWSTVHTIEDVDLDTGFALRPAMRALRRMINVAPGVLERLATERAAQLRGLHVELCYEPAVHWLLRTALPPSPVARLEVHGVPPRELEMLRACASRHSEMTLIVEGEAPTAPAR